MIGGDFNSHYQIALKPMVKQQLLLGRILNTKHIKKFGSSWKRDFKAIKEQWTNKPSNVSDLISAPEGEGDVSDTDTDSDSTDDGEDSCDSAGEGKPGPNNFLESILSAPRPWSINGKCESIIQETTSDNMHRMAETTRGPRDAVVGKPPPSTTCPTIVNPYPGPSESPDYLAIGPGYKHQELYCYMKDRVAICNLSN